MSTNCMIIFDHPNSIYNSGDTLKGIVKLQTSKLKSIKGISIKVIGYGRVFWFENRRYNRVCYDSHEQYLNSINYVVGSADGSSIDFQPGCYEYNFTCELPIQLPTSILENNYTVVYEVIVAIERRIRCDNLFQRQFIVINTLNLNIMELDLRPRKYLSEMKLKAPMFFCRDEGELKVEFNLPSDGYLPGQQIPLTLMIYNKSNYNLAGAQIKLMKCYLLESTHPSIAQHKIENVIDSRFCDNIPRNTNKEFKYTFYIPLLPPSNSTRYFQLKYVIKLEINCNYFNKFYFQCPITIGTTPQPILNPASEGITNVGPVGIHLPPVNMTTRRRVDGWLPCIRNFFVEYKDT